MAYYRIGTIGLSRTVITNEQQLRDTLVHEYAHLLAYVRYGRKGVGHGPPWKQAMTDLGAHQRCGITTKFNEMRAGRRLPTSAKNAAHF